MDGRFDEFWGTPMSRYGLPWKFYGPLTDNEFVYPGGRKS